MDPVDNPMNYNWPKCQGDFTQGQGTRMRNTWLNVRNFANEKVVKLQLAGQRV